MSSVENLSPPPFSLSPSAQAQLAQLIQEDGRTPLFFRISVSGGGCAGFQYHFGFETQKNSEDLSLKEAAVEVIIDPISLSLIEGSKLDYVTELIGARFEVQNPNAQSSCGCGTSFSL